MVKKIPEDMHTITPSLIVKDAAKAIELYKNAFGAKEVARIEFPGTAKIMHAVIQIGDSQIFLADANPKSQCGTPTSSSFYVYLENVDESFKKAKEAGLTEQFPLQDMFWGDRTGSVIDPFGNSWCLATHVKDVPPEELEEAKKKFMMKEAA